jgi:pimeloyl-ACP methyl ester carboxylesterase
MSYAVNSGVRIHYVVEGSGPPLVLHVGFVGAIEDWYEAGFVAALRQDYRLILLDPRGQGQSDKPHDPGAYTQRERIGDVLAILDTLGIERAHFFGYSLGGRVGFALGAHVPNRLSSLILGGANPYDLDHQLEENPMYQLLQKGMAAFVAGFEQDDPDFWLSEGERTRWLASDPKALIAALTAGFSNPSLATALPTIRTPTLIYCGTNDDPEPKARAAREMPNATYVAIEGLDHAGAINRSELVAPHVTTFLDRHSGDDEQISTTRDDQLV